MYLWLEFRNTGRIFCVARVKPDALVHLAAFLGPGGMLRTLLGCSFRLRSEPHPGLQQRWSELKLTYDFDFAYTSPHDYTHLRKAIFLCQNGSAVLYKAAFDEICAANLKNELDNAGRFGTQFWVGSERPFSIVTRFRFLVPVVHLPRRAVIAIASQIAKSSGVDTSGTLAQTFTHGDLNTRNVKRQVGGWRKYFLVDFEFSQQRSLAYDYFYFYLNKRLQQGDLDGILDFLRADRHRPLVIAGVDVGRRYTQYLEAFLQEWLGFFCARAHDPGFQRVHTQLVQRVRSAIQLDQPGAKPNEAEVTNCTSA